MTYHRIAPSVDPSFQPFLQNYFQFTRELPLCLQPIASDLINRISSVNWYLEWQLPGWLGRTFHMASSEYDILTLGNIFGLSFIRLQDDIFDQEDVPIIEGLPVLRNKLFNRWMDQYRKLFDAKSSFWDHLHCYLGQWLRAELENCGPCKSELRNEENFSSSQSNPVQQLSRRGAPLKICCIAACMKSGNDHLLPNLLAGCDHLLAGMVLLDHAEDWQDDLQAGKYNAFITYLIFPEENNDNGMLSNNTVDTNTTSDNHAKVLAELYLGINVKHYFKIAQNQFRQARFCIQEINLPELDKYLSWADSETIHYQNHQIKVVQQQVRQAVSSLLRNSE
jgi:hypothetical protein